VTTISADEWASAPLTGVVHEEPWTMDTQIKAVWVAALRSGLYKQGFDRLRTEDTYTPLGVLCDIATKVNVCTWDCVDGEYFIAPMQPPTTGAFLPVIVRDWAGIKGTHPSQEAPLSYEGALHPVWRLSDIFRLDFDTIADLLEEHEPLG
jgi:hypothetical protein